MGFSTNRNPVVTQKPTADSAVGLKLKYSQYHSIMTSNRTPEQMNTALDRTESILADLTIRLDRLEVSLERLEAKVESNTEAIGVLTVRLDQFADETHDSIARTNAAVDRLTGVFTRYMEQTLVERDYQRTVNLDVRDRLGRLESGE